MHRNRMDRCPENGVDGVNTPFRGPLVGDFCRMRSRIVRQEQDFALPYVTGGSLASVSSNCLQKRVESTVSPSPRIFQYGGSFEQKKKHSISFLP